MTREEALNKAINIVRYFEANFAKSKEAMEDLENIIEVLEQEPCEDCISRQAAKRALEDRFIELQKRHDDKRYETNYCLNTILELPSVNPQEPVLDKIRAEIMSKDGLEEALEIIDKYKTESEE